HRPPLLQRDERQPLPVARHEMQPALDLIDQLLVAGYAAVEHEHGADVHVGGVALEVEEGRIEPGEPVGSCHDLILPHARRVWQGRLAFRAVTVPGEPYDDPIRPLYGDAAGDLPPGTEWFDVHTHMGANDPDGFRCTAEEVMAALDRAGHAQALVFPMHEPDGYAAANDRVLVERRRPDGAVRDGRPRPDPLRQ